MSATTVPSAIVIDVSTGSPCWVVFELDIFVRTGSDSAERQSPHELLKVLRRFHSAATHTCRSYLGCVLRSRTLNFKP